MTRTTTNLITISIIFFTVTLLINLTSSYSFGPQPSSYANNFHSTFIRSSGPGFNYGPPQGPPPPPRPFPPQQQQFSSGFPPPPQHHQPQFSPGGGYGSFPGVSFSPQGIYPSNNNCQLKVKCQPIQTGQGVYDFNCAMANPCVIQREDILWLKGITEQQQVNVVVPNYKVQEVIKAAFKSAPGPPAHVNILLKRPHYHVEAEHQTIIGPQHPPQVNLQYEPTPPKEIVHYPIHKPYRQLSGPILEPGPGPGGFHTY